MNLTAKTGVGRSSGMAFRILTHKISWMTSGPTIRKGRIDSRCISASTDCSGDQSEWQVRRQLIDLGLNLTRDGAVSLDALNRWVHMQLNDGCVTGRYDNQGGYVGGLAMTESFKGFFVEEIQQQRAILISPEGTPGCQWKSWTTTTTTTTTTFALRKLSTWSPPNSRAQVSRESKSKNLPLLLFLSKVKPWAF